MAFMPEDVLNKNFTATQFRRGYDEHEVDDFLDEIVVEMRRLTSENEDLSRQLTSCLEGKGVTPPEAKDQIAAATAAVDAAVQQAEKDSVARIAKANAEAERAEAHAAERQKAAEEAAEQIASSAPAVPAEPSESAEPSGSVDHDKDQAEASTDDVEAAAPGVGSAAGVLALAEKLHAEYVTEGQQTRERLIAEGQSRHDQVIGEATAKQKELRESAQAKHDALIAEATARHEKMITDARERASGMVAEAVQKRAEVLQGLSHERGDLEKKIDELKVFERDYRARLKAHLEGQLHQLDQIGADEAPQNDPANDDPAGSESAGSDSDE